MNQGLKNSNINDNIYTPINAILPLIKYIPNHYTIWECTDNGESNISKLFKEYNYNVISTNTSFFMEYPDNFDMIITNPPFSLKNDFLSRCYHINKPFALLLPITSLEGVYRGKLFNKYGIQLIILNKRINYINQKNNNWFNSSWFTYGLNLDNDLIFESL